MRYFVTGSGGFVMSVFIERLLRHDPEATVVGADLSGPDAVLEEHFRAVSDRLRLATVDVRDAEGVRELVRSAAPDAIVHGATITHDPASEHEHPSRFLDVNILGTANLLDVARQTRKLRRFVLVSSAAVYGDSLHHVVTEDTTPSPDEMYGISKWASECSALRYAELDDLPLTIARLTKMFGPMERPTLGRKAMSLPYHLASAVVGGRKLAVTERTLWASGDWLDTTEAATALCVLAEDRRGGSHVYNIGSGLRTTVPELVSHFGGDLVEVAEPEEAEVDVDPGQDHGKNGVVSPERLDGELGWSCRPLDAQVAGYLEWAARHREFFAGA